MRFLTIDAFIAALSTTTQLEYLKIFHYGSYMFPASAYPEQRTAYSTPSTRDPIVLRSLIIFHFEGPSKFLEDLVSKIDMPLLEQLYVSFHQLVLDIPQLSQFISKIEHMNSLPYRMSIFFFTDTITIEYNFEHLPPRHNPILLSFSVKKYAMLRNWQASEVLHICGQLSPFTSSVEWLGIMVKSESEGSQ